MYRVLHFDYYWSSDAISMKLSNLRFDLLLHNLILIS